MNLNVPDLRKGLRRNSNQTTPTKTKDDRRKIIDRRSIVAERVNSKKVTRIWLTPRVKALLQDMFFLDEK